MLQLRAAIVSCALMLFAPRLAAQDGERAVARDLGGRIEGPAYRYAATRVTVWRNDMERGTVEPLCDGSSDASGRFAFRAVPWLQGFDWGHNTMIVTARAGHEAVGILEVRGDHANLATLAVELRDAVDITGVVRARDGKPVAGAAVWPWLFATPGADKKQVWLTAPMVPWLVRTDAQGCFTLKGMPAAMHFTMTVQHPDHAEQRVEVSGGGKVEVTLEPGASIAGVVRMPDGMPAGGVMVSAQGHNGHWTRVQADGAGRYVLRSLPRDEFNVWAEADGLTVVALDSVAARPGEPLQEQDLQLVRGGFITGRIVDVANGKPVQPGATADVAMYGPARPRSGAGCEVVPVQRDGTFRIRAPAGVNYVYLRPGEGWADAGNGLDVKVMEGEEARIEFKAVKAAKAK